MLTRRQQRAAAAAVDPFDAVLADVDGPESAHERDALRAGAFGEDLQVTVGVGDLQRVIDAWTPQPPDLVDRVRCGVQRVLEHRVDRGAPLGDEVGEAVAGDQAAPRVQRQRPALEHQRIDRRLRQRVVADQRAFSPRLARQAKGAEPAAAFGPVGDAGHVFDVAPARFAVPAPRRSAGTPRRGAACRTAVAFSARRCSPASNPNTRRPGMCSAQRSARRLLAGLEPERVPRRLRRVMLEVVVDRVSLALDRAQAVAARLRDRAGTGQLVRQAVVAGEHHARRVSWCPTGR